MPDPRQQAEQLLRLLEQRDEKGQRRFPIGDVKNLLALVMIRGRIPVESMPPQVQGVMGELAMKVGVTANTPPSELAKLIEHYFAKNPLNPELMKEFRALLAG